MPRALVVVGSTHVVEGAPSLIYTVSIFGIPKPYSYLATYDFNNALDTTANFLAWRNAIVAEAADNKVTIALADVDVFGFPFDEKAWAQENKEWSEMKTILDQAVANGNIGQATLSAVFSKWKNNLTSLFRG